MRVLEMNGIYNCNEELTAEGRVHDKDRIKYIEGFLKWVLRACYGNYRGVITKYEKTSI